MLILSSKALAQRIHARSATEVTMLSSRGIDPQLAVLLVGEDAASHTYVGIKEKRAKEIGITFSSYYLPDGVLSTELASTISFLNTDEDVNGLILQLPLPKLYETETLLASISKTKDVDGLTNAWTNAVRSDSPNDMESFSSQPVLYPPMVEGVLSLLSEYDIAYQKSKIVIVGNGRLVGSPLFEYLSRVGCDVTIVTEDTPHITTITQQADVLICGTGQPDLITYQWVKPGATVIDCAHDIHLDSVSQVAGALAPSIGGVGPLTVAWLLNNTVRATLEAHG